jgi:hypothetical protein
MSQGSHAYQRLCKLYGLLLRKMRWLEWMAERGLKPLAAITPPNPASVEQLEQRLMLSGDPLNDGLVAHWSFDETPGLVAEDHAADHDGVLLNGGYRDVGQLGSAVVMDGVNDRVDVSAFE